RLTEERPANSKSQSQIRPQANLILTIEFKLIVPNIWSEIKLILLECSYVPQEEVCPRLLESGRSNTVTTSRRCAGTGISCSVETECANVVTTCVLRLLIVVINEAKLKRVATFNPTHV